MPDMNSMSAVVYGRRTLSRRACSIPLIGACAVAPRGAAKLPSTSANATALMNEGFMWCVASRVMDVSTRIHMLIDAHRSGSVGRARGGRGLPAIVSENSEAWARPRPGLHDSSGGSQRDVIARATVQFPGIPQDER